MCFQNVRKLSKEFSRVCLSVVVTELRLSDAMSCSFQGSGKLQISSSRRCNVLLFMKNKERAAKDPAINQLMLLVLSNFGNFVNTPLTSGGSTCRIARSIPAPSCATAWKVSFRTRSRIASTLSPSRLICMQAQLWHRLRSSLVPRNHREHQKFHFRRLSIGFIRKDFSDERLILICVEVWNAFGGIRSIFVECSRILQTRFSSIRLLVLKFQSVCQFLSGLEKSRNLAKCWGNYAGVSYCFRLIFSFFPFC